MSGFPARTETFTQSEIFAYCCLFFVDFPPLTPVILTILAPYATLTEFDFDNTKAASVSITFLKYEDLLNFLNIIETKEFLTNFVYVTVSAFDPYQGGTEESEIQLNMQFQFTSEDGKNT